MVGEQIGLDEGGVLEALRDPLWTETVKKIRHNAKGQVTSETTTVKQYTGAHALAALVVILGPAVLLKFYTGVFTNPEVRDAVKDVIFPDLGPITDIIIPGSTEGGSEVLDLIKNFLDPFNFFD